ncbi:hypothetical protein B0T19DRAFT_197597 [Cercophora scortea]|uniref:Uncharacterized protein n=1 Tax=Cercophora scortea TaxID=314031 RepID=A0AAE0MDR5_9PEZI|nr:hypothetical protein B0T19DRAFT_197597 [Cercophora scortea]
MPKRQPPLYIFIYSSTCTISQSSSQKCTGSVRLPSSKRPTMPPWSIPDDEIRISARELEDAPPNVKEYLFKLSGMRQCRKPDGQVVPANLPSSNLKTNIRRFLDDAREFVTRLAQSPTQRSGGEIPARSTLREEPVSSARETEATSQITELLYLLARIEEHCS